MGLAAVFGFGRVDRMMRDVNDAIAAVAEALPGFAAFDAVIGDDGRAALTIAPDGRIALVRVRGARAFAREVQWPMLRQTPAGILIEPVGRRTAPVLLVGLNAIDIRRLGMPPLVQPELATIVPELTAA